MSERVLMFVKKLPWWWWVLAVLGPASSFLQSATGIGYPLWLQLIQTLVATTVLIVPFVIIWRLARTEKRI